MLQFAIQLHGEIILFSTKTTLRSERVSQNGECLKKIFRVHVSDIYFLPRFEF